VNFRRWGVSWVTAIAACWPGTAAACSCSPAPPAPQAYASASAVFVATVVSRSRLPDGGGTHWRAAYAVEFAVSNWFKGAGHDRVVVVTGEGGGDCGIPFEVGQTYLVYAFGSDPLVAHRCSRTGLLADSVGDIQELERHQSNRSAQVVGVVGVLVAFAVGVACGRAWRRRRAATGAPGTAADAAPDRGGT
jgi:hypothetical protein